MMKKSVRIALINSVVFDNYTVALKEAGKTLEMNVTPVWFGKDGSDPALLSPDQFDPKDFDALVLPGGGDIDPSFYHEIMNGSIFPDPDLDHCQMNMLDTFVKTGKPVLGICRGHQLVNVYFGGSLIQDLPEKDAHKKLTGKEDNRHMITAEPGSVLYELYGEHFPVNSAHHQGAYRIGEGLKVTARCDDGVIEALEHTVLPIMTVQFHPERMDYLNRRDDTVAGGKIFEWFLKQLR